MEWIRQSGLTLGVFPALEAQAPALRFWFASRLGGVSPSPFDTLNLGESVGDARANVRENRRKLLDALGIGPRRVARGGQVHGRRIATVASGGVYRGTDGFITTATNLALAISTADCFPVAIYSPSERTLALLHVGRGGASHGIITAALETMVRRYRINTREAVALIGPGICGRCYTVGRDIARRFPSPYVHRRGALYHLDLIAHCTDQLVLAGLRGRNIYRAGLCTACDPTLFYSYRRDGGATGRHWTLAMIVPAP